MTLPTAREIKLEQQVKKLQEERRKALVLEIENQDLKDTIEKIRKLDKSDCGWFEFDKKLKELLSDKGEKA